eukprot:1161874-Rhodomonas_salina.3
MGAARRGATLDNLAGVHPDRGHRERARAARGRHLDGGGELCREFLRERRHLRRACPPQTPPLPPARA